MSDLLLHSLDSFEPLITDLLTLTGAKSAVEIGGEGGVFTERLVSWANSVDGDAYCIDPAPSARLTRLAEESSHLRLVRRSSPTALARLPRVDAYIVDGDHNYWTVSEELQFVSAMLHDPERPCIVLLHDVAWPAARRDQYYAPERIPAGAVHALSWNGGAVPDQAEMQATGFGPAGQYAWATREGGPHNGVLTAVEDFLAKHDGLELHVVQAVFGLGILFASEAPWAAAVRSRLEPFRDPLLARLEANRIELYLEVLRLQQVLGQRTKAHQVQLAQVRGQTHSRPGPLLRSSTVPQP